MRLVEIKFLLLYLFIAGAVFLLDGAKLLEIPKVAAYVAVSPGQYVLYQSKAKLADWFSFLTFWRSGEARIKNLEQRVLELSVVKGRAEALEKENVELRKQLGVGPLALRKELPATVLGLSRYLEIEVGKDSAVAIGDSVVYGNNLVGRVRSVSGRVAFVQLPRDSEAKISVLVGGVRALSSGEFNSSIKLSQMAQNEDVRTGDMVITSGEGGYVPALAVGQVGKVTTDVTGLFKEAEVVPAVSYVNLRTVFVILD